MNGRKILASPRYFDLIGRAMKPGSISDATDFMTFLNDLKWKLKSTGEDELFDELIREEIRMHEQEGH